jgi:outer membrane protein OmpA-like peptidoglycan-associated protein
MKQFLLILFSISALCAFAQPDTTEIKKLKYTNVKFYLGQKKVLKDVLLYDAWAMGKLDIYPAVADSLAKFLLLRKNIVIELGGHSNCANAKDPGTNAAKAVKDYLVTKGVPADRIQTHGYGNALPLVKCPEAGEPTSDTYANRRVEAKIVDFVKPSFTYQDSILYSGQVMVLRDIVTLNIGGQFNVHSKADSLADFLIKNKNVGIEIGYHTDTKQDDKYSKDMSLKYAKAIKDYLISKGVSADKLTEVGYGESMPVVPCPQKAECGEDVHSKNRRVEIKIVSVE